MEVEPFRVRNRHVRSILGSVVTVLRNRQDILKNIIAESRRQMEIYMILWEQQGNGCEWYQYISEGDNCDACNRLNGNKIKISEARTAFNLPPMHPNCDCRIAVLDKNGRVSAVAGGRNTKSRNSAADEQLGLSGSEKKAIQIIMDNKAAIIGAGKEFSVNPGIIAACIYTEQALNVDWKDALTDRSLYFFDTSIGIGQVKISTAKTLEDVGYMPKTGAYKVYANRVEVSREEAIADKLTDNKTNVKYVAAYLAYWQDKWKEVFPEINNQPVILGTLYNLGSRANIPNTNPRSNKFGEYVKSSYRFMRKLLDMEEQKS